MHCRHKRVTFPAESCGMSRQKIFLAQVSNFVLNAKILKSGKNEIEVNIFEESVKTQNYLKKCLPRYASFSYSPGISTCKLTKKEMDKSIDYYKSHNAKHVWHPMGHPAEIETHPPPELSSKGKGFLWKILMENEPSTRWADCGT